MPRDARSPTKFILSKSVLSWHCADTFLPVSVARKQLNESINHIGSKELTRRKCHVIGKSHKKVIL